MFDPDVRDFQGSIALPPEVWRIQDLAIPEILEDHNLIERGL